MKFLSCPLATYGFVYPAIAVALALQRQGHEVAFVTGTAFAETLREAGIERIPRGDKDGQSFPIDRWADPLVIAMEVKHIEYALGRFAADALVAHPLSLGPLLVRERTGLPVAILGMASHLWPTRAQGPEMPQREARKAWRHQDIMRYFNEARQVFKLAPVEADPWASPMLGDLFLLQTVPELGGAAATYPELVHMVGACLWEPPAVDAELEAWLDAAASSAEPLIYVQHGRVFDRPSFWPWLVDALAGRPFRVAASIGRMDRPSGPTPWNFLVRAHLSQGVVMARARMALAGANTTVILGALTHGLPSVLVPGGGEQPDLAEDVARAGAAITLPLDEAHADALKAAVLRGIEDAALRQRARALQEAFARVDGPLRAAELIERLAKTRRPVLRGDIEATMPHDTAGSPMVTKVSPVRELG